MRIMFRKNTLISKNGFNRCSITRLVVDTGAESEKDIQTFVDKKDDDDIQELGCTGINRLMSRRIKLTMPCPLEDQHHLSKQRELLQQLANLKVDTRDHLKGENSS